MSPPDLLLAVTLPTVYVIYTIAIALAVARLVRGPRLADRVVALDMAVVCAISLIAVDAIQSGQSMFLRSAVLLALLSPLGTIVFALHIRRRGTE